MWETRPVLLNNLVRQAAGQTGAVRLHVELRHLAVLHHHGEPLTPSGTIGWFHSTKILGEGFI